MRGELKYRNDHQSDKNRNGQVHLRDFGGADRVKDVEKKMTQDNANDDTETLAFRTILPVLQRHHN